MYPPNCGLLRRVYQNVAAATTLTLETEFLKRGEFWHVERLTLRNRTRGGSTIVVKITGAGGGAVIEAIYDLSNNAYEVYQVDLWLKEDEKLEIAWSDIVASDLLDTHLVGKIYNAVPED